MSITDELRKWGRATLADTSLLVRMEAIADRIDAEHESKVAEVASGWDYWESTHIELPKDADGEPIHVGDVMEWVRYEDDDPTIVRNVSAVGNGVFFAWSDEQGRYAQYEACAYRHHHEPTVEDVLREFAYGLGVPVADSYIAASAAKLKLADGEDA